MGRVRHGRDSLASTSPFFRRDAGSAAFPAVKVAPFETVALSPAEVRSLSTRLRQRSRNCAELADSCMTDDAREILESMSEQFDREAQKLDFMLGESAGGDRPT